MPNQAPETPAAIELRSGENSNQVPARHCPSDNDDPLALHRFGVIEGAMGYNNLCDLDRLAQTYTHLAAGFLKRGHLPAIMLIAKHGNCCGAAVGEMNNSGNVCLRAGLGDPIAAFGGFALTNIPMGGIEAAKLLEPIQGHLLDGIAAPCFATRALEVLHRKKDGCRILECWGLAQRVETLDTSPRSRQVRGGRLEQPNYTHVLDLSTDVTRYGPERPELEDDLVLAWGIGATSNSNTITLVKAGKLIANAVGQQDRVGAVEVARFRAIRSYHDTVGAVAYSDGFFPFPDAVELLADMEIRAILAPQGSINDKKTIEACEAKGVTLYLTPYRGFFNH